MFCWGQSTLSWEVTGVLMFSIRRQLNESKTPVKAAYKCKSKLNKLPLTENKYKRLIIFFPRGFKGDKFHRHTD